MLVGFEFNYRSFQKLTPEQWAELREAIPGLEAEKPAYSYKTYVTDWYGIQKLGDMSLEITIKQMPDDHRMFVRMLDRIEKLEAKSSGKNWAHELANGASVVIHIPDQTLMKIDEVTWLEDSCTELLQSHLNEGWRILAVCPPNAQRRPDYILGRRSNAI